MKSDPAIVARPTCEHVASHRDKACSQCAAKVRAEFAQMAEQYREEPAYIQWRQRLSTQQRALLDDLRRERAERQER